VTRTLAWLEHDLACTDHVFWRGALARMGVSIRWGRFRPVKIDFTSASYRPDTKVITVNPILSQLWVPDEVVSFSIYHETIHAIQRPSVRSHGAGYKHDHEFRVTEMRHPHAVEAEIWEHDNYEKLIAARPERVKPC
jgi:hypothetical protein